MEVYLVYYMPIYSVTLYANFAISINSADGIPTIVFLVLVVFSYNFNTIIVIIIALQIVILYAIITQYPMTFLRSPLQNPGNSR